MNKEWKQEDLDKFSETYKDFKERCKHVVVVLNEIYTELTENEAPYCFEDFYIDEYDDVAFSIYTSTHEKQDRVFPKRLLTINDDSELKYEILKEMCKGIFDDGTEDKLMHVLKTVVKYKPTDTFKNNKDEHKTLEVVNEKTDIRGQEWSITMKGLNSIVTKEALNKFHDCCTDGRFEMIERVKNKLIEATNIETADDEMKVIDNILFRFWQMGWLKMIDDNI